MGGHNLHHGNANVSSDSIIISQSEPAATNAPVGHSVHSMGCIFYSVSHGVHHSQFLFSADHHTFFFCIIFGFFLWTRPHT
jgi:hypothetical protein